MAAILYDLLNESPNIKIEISLVNLIEAIDYAAKSSIAELERQRQAQPEQYLTRRQTAEMLDVDLSTLWRWNKENYLCTIKVGRRIRYRMSDVKKLFESTKERKAARRDEPAEAGNPPAILSKSICDCGFSTRIINSFRLYNIDTVGDLLKIPEEKELFRIRYLGTSSVSQIMQYLKDNNLKLGMVQ